jgi:transglutaminase-like putative cysteine protease
VVTKRQRECVVSGLTVLITWAVAHSLVALTEAPPNFLYHLFWITALVAGIGLALRWARLPLWVVVTAQFVAMIWLLHVQATGAFFPGSTSLSQWWVQIAEGIEAANFYAPPIPVVAPSLGPLFLLLGCCIWWLTESIANHRRQPAVAGLAWLAFFAIPQGMTAPAITWWWYALAGIGFLALIWLHEQAAVGKWATPNQQQTRNQSASSAIAVGAVGLGLLVAPLTSIGSLTLFGFGGAGGDNEEIVLSNPITDLRRDLRRGADTEVVRVRTEGDPSYLRIAVLTKFDGETWSAGEREIPATQTADGLIPLSEGLRSSVLGPATEYTINISDDFASRWLPTYAQLRTIEADGDWRYDNNVLDIVSARENQDTTGMSYRLSAAQQELSPKILASAPRLQEGLPAVYSDLPSDLPSYVRDLAFDRTQGYASRYEKAVALQKWFRSGAFTYDLSVDPSSGSDALVEFLSPGGRRGYCEQFASAMAIMARTLGIPARVAVGFARPEQLSSTSYSFSTWDLHAWPELYFEGVGWVRFEPTPATRIGAAPRYTRVNFADENSPDTPTETPSDSPDSATTGPQVTERPNIEDNPSSAEISPTPAETDGSASWGLLLSSLLALLSLTLLWFAPAAWRMRQRRQRLSWPGTDRQFVENVWQEIVATGRDHGRSLTSGRSMRELAASVNLWFGNSAADERPLQGVGINPDADAALGKIVDLIEESRYAAAVPAVDAHQIRQLTLTVCTAITQGSTPQVRRRANRWPASLWYRTKPVMPIDIEDEQVLVNQY